MPVDVRQLRPEDGRKTFRSGNDELDRFFSRYAGQNQFRHHVGTTYVALEVGAIVGFVTVSASHVEIDDLPEARRRSLPRYPLPVLRLARLAVASSAQRRGVGDLLVATVFRVAHEMARTVGCVGIVVDALADAIPFYERLGFEPLPTTAGSLEDRPEPRPMFLPRGSIPSDD